jgi:hypothetical protein
MRHAGSSGPVHRAPLPDAPATLHERAVEAELDNPAAAGRRSTASTRPLFIRSG